MAGPYDAKPLEAAGTLVTWSRSSRRGRRRRPARATRTPSLEPCSLVITASDLELRAGSRILLSGATLRVQPGDRIGLVGRNGAGKTTIDACAGGRGGALRRRGRLELAGRVPAAGSPRGRPLGHREGPGAVRARASTSCCRKMEKVAVGDGRARRRGGERQAGARVRAHRGALLRARRVRRGERGGPDLREPGPPGPGARPADAHALRRPAPPGGAGPDPVRRVRRRHRRAPPRCCSTSPRTTSTPTRSPGCAGSCSATRAGSW